MNGLVLMIGTFQLLQDWSLMLPVLQLIALFVTQNLFFLMGRPIPGLLPIQ